MEPKPDGISTLNFADLLAEFEGELMKTAAVLGYYASIVRDGTVSGPPHGFIPVDDADAMAEALLQSLALRSAALGDTYDQFEARVLAATTDVSDRMRRIAVVVDDLDAANAELMSELRGRKRGGA